MELLSTQVVSNLLAALMPQEDSVDALAAVSPGSLLHRPAASGVIMARAGTDAWYCSRQLHGALKDVRWMIFQEPEPTGGLSAAAGCCTVGIGALSSVSA